MDDGFNFFVDFFSRGFLGRRFVQEVYFPVARKLKRFPRFPSHQESKKSLKKLQKSSIQQCTKSPNIRLPFIFN
jgi:hypothetical protein